MARVSRRPAIASQNNHVTPQKEEQQVVFHAGIYVRLSVVNSGIGEDCESLENQEALLREYIDAKPDIRLIEVYSDNGETGTDFERPGFRRMLEDVRSGKINCILVKDLSRFGRNYIETGEYIEKIFPFLGVRFIAVCDDFDTHNPNCVNDGTVFSLKNLINEAYARDISAKIHAAFDAKRQNGEMKTKNAPYGYKLSGDPKHPYIIDEEAADNVRLIFRMKIEGISTNAIARHMEAAGCLTPLRYMKEKGWVTQCRENSHWDMSAINRILTNPVYLGHMVQGKTVVRLCDNIPKTVLPPEQWTIIENINPPIVDPETYDAVQRIIAKQKAQHRERCGKYDYLKTEPILPGLVFCACCGKPMIRRKNVVSPKSCLYYYICPTYRIHKDSVCPNKHGVREDELLTIVWEQIRRDMERLDDLEKRMARARGSSSYRSRLSQIEQSITKAEYRLKKLKAYLLSAFESSGSGEMSEKDYEFVRCRYEKQMEEVEDELVGLYAQKEKVNEEATTSNRWMAEFGRFRMERGLTKEIAAALVERIEIAENKRVTVVLKYRSDYQNLLENTEKMEGEDRGFAG